MRRVVRAACYLGRCSPTLLSEHSSVPSPAENRQGGAMPKITSVVNVPRYERLQVATRPAVITASPPVLATQFCRWRSVHSLP
jgi:hypothetical protein